LRFVLADVPQTRTEYALRWLPLLSIALSLSASRAAKVDIHYAPSENLESIDVDLINQAENSIDMAAYVLSDAAVIEALGDAADRGVAVRLYLDPSEYRDPTGALAELFAKDDVQARVKVGGPIMHMKAYAVDRARLRTGSGNFSRSGLSRQDNDLVVTDDKQTVGRFERDFEAIFAGGAAP
jgi:phosphatidylserine/phosphatidylglycerophosphate/cardiolipin synthase-like enzyme